MHPQSVLGLGDGGAHVDLICDAGYPSFLLSYWVRDRERGTLPLETAVKILKALSSLLLIAVVALYALAIYLAQGRRRLLLGATGASLVLVGLVIASLRRFLGGAIVDALVKTEANKQPVRVIWSLETSVANPIISADISSMIIITVINATPRSDPRSEPAPDFTVDSMSTSSSSSGKLYLYRSTYASCRRLTTVDRWVRR